MKILMCTSGKKNAEGAIELGSSLFKGKRVDATILYVGGSEGRKHLKRAKEIASSYGINAKTKTRSGEPTVKILKEAKEGGYDVVVTGYKELTRALRSFKDIFVNRQIEDIASRTTASMLVVKSPRKIRKVLICTAGTNDSERAVRFFASLKVKAEVDVVNVIPEVYHRFKDILEPLAEEQLEVFTKLPGERTEHLYKAKEMLAKRGIDANVILKEGNFVEEVTRLSEKGYDLIVMGMRSERKKGQGMSNRTMGVIRSVQIPVLAIK